MTWHDSLDKEILSIRDSWANGGSEKFQIIGDNWDKNILPSYRTSEQKTLSLHLFNVIAVVDRVPTDHMQNMSPPNIEELDYSKYFPSTGEQNILLAEMTFLFAHSVLSNLPKLEEHFKQIYPKHLDHKYSTYCGIKTTQVLYLNHAIFDSKIEFMIVIAKGLNSDLIPDRSLWYTYKYLCKIYILIHEYIYFFQFPLGLYRCNENKTAELIQLLKDLTQKYVPQLDGEIVEEVFFGGMLLILLYSIYIETARKVEPVIIK